MKRAADSWRCARGRNFTIFFQRDCTLYMYFIVSTFYFEFSQIVANLILKYVFGSNLMKISRYYHHQKYFMMFFYKIPFIIAIIVCQTIIICIYFIYLFRTSKQNIRIISGNFVKKFRYIYNYFFICVKNVILRMM